MDTPTPIQPKKGDAGANNATSTVAPVEKEIEYTPAELQYHMDVMRLVRNARVEREKPRMEFNDMGYTEQDMANVRTDLAYVPPATDKYDIRMVSGLTREKTNTALALALSYDFDTEFIAYDKDDTIIRELGEAAGDLVEKSNQLELWRQNRSVPYRGMIARGTYFTMEVQEFPTHSRKTPVPLSMIGRNDATWTDRPRKGKVQFHTLEIDPRMVIVGDLKVMSMGRQPFVAVGRVISEAMARAMFGTWDRWKNVPLRTNQFNYKAGADTADFFTYYRENLAVSDTLSEGDVELVYFMRSLPFGNELCIYLNGMSMLPIQVRGQDKATDRWKVSGFPLTSISASGEYPIVDWHFERIPGFFYSKGNPAKTKFDEDILNFWFRFMVKKAIRSINPTLGNKSGQTISKKDLQGGKILSNLRKDDLFSILPPEMIQGISTGEVSMMEMLKKEIEEKTVTKEFSGQTGNPYQSATQFSENQKSQLLRLGALIDGIIRGEMRRADLRLRNSIVPYWMSKENKQSSKQTIGETVADIYDTFTLEKQGKDGKSSSVISIGTFDKISPFDIMAQEDKEMKSSGDRKAYTYLDPEKIDFMRTLFYVNVKPRDKENNAMQRMLFNQDVVQAKNMFGPQATNDDSLKVKFAQMRGDEYDEWFQEEQQMDPDALANAMMGAGEEVEQGGSGGMNASSAVPPERLMMES